MNAFDYHRLVALAKDDVDIVFVHKPGRPSKLFRHQNHIKKFVFFLWREGLTSTLRKIRSRRFQDRVEKEVTFVICKLRGEKLFVGGWQFSIAQPYYYFLPASVKDHEPTLAEYAGIIELNPFVGVQPGVMASQGSSTLQINKSFQPTTTRQESPHSTRVGDLFLVGCGDYVRTQVLPLFKRFNPRVAVDFNIEVLRSDYLQAFQVRTNDFDVVRNVELSNRIQCCIVASYHSYHTDHALALLDLPGSKVFIEKPPCVTREDLHHLVTRYDPSRIFIGYNRRFLEWNERVREILATYPSPAIITMHITEAQIDAGHWYLAPNQGTRVTGNLCHFVDLAMFLVQKRPASISIAKNKRLGIDFSIFTLIFDDGTIVNFVPSDLGDGTRGVQETIHIRNEDVDIHIDDYLTMRVWVRGNVSRYHKVRRDKGHRAMYMNFINAIEHDIPSAYTRQDLVRSTVTYQSFVKLFYSENDSMDLQFTLDQ